MTIFKQKQSGFTLVEVLVSITILLMVIVGPMKIIARSVNSTNFASQESTAWFLAQEGLELAQKGRDDLVLQNFENSSVKPFTKFLNDYSACFGINGCSLTVNTAGTLVTAADCGSGAVNCLLYLKSGVQRSPYQLVSSGNTVTPYTRVIKMTSVNGTDGKVREIAVTSTVTWRTGSLIAGQKVTASTYLFNIYDTD